MAGNGEKGRKAFPREKKKKRKNLKRKEVLVAVWDWVRAQEKKLKAEQMERTLLEGMVGGGYDGVGLDHEPRRWSKRKRRKVRGSRQS